MSGLADQPFSEYEQRFVLAEILKESAISPAELVRIIQDKRIQPRWTAMRIPNGRSIDSCVANFSYMIGQPMPQLPPPIPQPFPLFGTPQSQTPRLGTKRLSSELSPAHGPGIGPNQPIQAHPGIYERSLPPIQISTSTVGDPLQARLGQPGQTQFSQFPAVNEPSTSIMYRPGQEAPGLGSGQKGKKRGRPSKEESRVRAAEAMARGEIYPRPKKAKNPRSSGGPPSGAEEIETPAKRARVSGASASEAMGMEDPTGFVPVGAPTGTISPRPRRPSAEDQRGAPDIMDVDTPERRARDAAAEIGPSGPALAEEPREIETGVNVEETRDTSQQPPTGPRLPDILQTTTTLAQESPTRSRDPLEPVVTQT